LINNYQDWFTRQSQTLRKKETESGGLIKHRNAPGGSRVSFKAETPFDNIESAQQFVELLIEAIEESRRDVDADIARTESNRSERQKQALQLVSDNLAKLSHHMTTSHRILNDLRTLRRMLLEERQLDKHYADYKR
jgi:hypothetical protein